MSRTSIFASLSNSSDLSIDYHFHFLEDAKYFGRNRTTDFLLAQEFCSAVLMLPIA
jgi:hypothetical protein